MLFLSFETETRTQTQMHSLTEGDFSVEGCTSLFYKTGVSCGANCGCIISNLNSWFLPLPSHFPHFSCIRCVKMRRCPCDMLDNFVQL